MSKIKPPTWCEHAIPTYRGWEDPKLENYSIRGFYTSRNR